MAACGAGIVLISYTAVPWLTTDNRPGFAKLGQFIPDPGPSANTVLFDWYFSWLGWALLATSIASIAVALLATRRASRWAAAAAAIIGVASIVITVLSLYLEAPRLLDVANGRLIAVFRESDRGFWFGIVGYLVGVVAAVMAWTTQRVGADANEIDDPSEGA